MILIVPITLKNASTLRTLQRLVASMRFQMIQQNGDMHEIHITVGTFVKPIETMHAACVTRELNLRQYNVAFITFVHFLFHVHVIHVRANRLVRIVTLLADITFEFLTMDSHVFAIRLNVTGYLFIAYFTAASMRIHMLSERALLHKEFPANFAFQQAIFGVHFFV